MKNNDFEDVKNQIKELSPSELEAHGVIVRAPNYSEKYPFYICPFCGSGSHQNQDSACSTKFIDGIYKWFCHSCMAAGEPAKDNLHVLAAHYGLDCRSDFAEIINRAASDFGGNLAKPRSSVPKKLHNAAPPPKEEISYLRLMEINKVISDAEKNLPNFIEKQGGSFRGLPLHVLQNFHCGYLKDWKHSKKITKSPRLIVPASTDYQKANYLARLTVPIDTLKETRISEKEHDGTKTLFNPDDLSKDLIFITEGYIDAMSIWYASNNGGVPVVALGGANQGATLLAAITDKNISGKKFVLLFDADIPAQNKDLHIKLRDSLIKSGNFAVCKFLIDFLPEDDQKAFGIKVDANQLLVSRGADYLRETLQKIIDSAQADFYLAEKKSADAKSAVISTFETKDTALRDGNPEIDPFAAQEALQAPFDTLDEQIADWQKINGEFNPALVDNIKDAYSIIDKICDDNISPAILNDNKIRQNLALLSFCDCFYPLADEFITQAKIATDKAKADYRDFRKKNADLATPDKDLVALSKFSVPKLIKDIDSRVSKLKKDAKDYRGQLHQDELNAKHQAFINSHASTDNTLNHCPVSLTIPARVILNETGIFIIDDSNPNKPKTQLAANTPIVPTRIFRDPVTNNTQYEIAIKIGNSWQYAIYDAVVLSDAKKVVNLAQDGALIAKPAPLTAYFASIIAANLDVIPTTKTYSKPGWHGDIFIFPPCGDQFIVRRDNINYADMFATLGDKQKWLKVYSKVMTNAAEPELTAIQNVIVGAALLAPCLKIFGLPNPQFLLWGSSDFAKTPIVKLALSIFGNPTIGKLFRTFDSSPKNRITMAIGLNDLPQAIDETESITPKEFENFQKSIYDFAAGVDGQKNTRDGKVRPAEHFRSVRIMTGEKPLIKENDKAGAMKRIIEIRADKPFMTPHEARALHIFVEKNHGHFGRDWIAYIQEKENQLAMKKTAEKIFSELDSLSEKNSTKFVVQNYNANHVFSVVYSLACIYHFHLWAGLIDAIDISDAVFDAKTILLKQPTTADMDETRRNLAALASLIDVYTKNFINKRIDPNDYETDSWTQKTGNALYGQKYKNGEVAIYPQALTILLKDLGVQSKKKFLADCADRDLLVLGKDDSLTPLRKINGSPSRVIVFKPEAFDNLQKQYEKTPDDEE